MAASALGPLPFGIVHDLSGSYRPALLSLATLPLLLAIITLFFDKSRKPEQLRTHPHFLIKNDTDNR